MTDRDKLLQPLKNASKASLDLADQLRSFASAKLDEATAASEDVTKPAWGDTLFDEIWKLLNEAGNNQSGLADGMFSFAQAIESLTCELGKPEWASVHKGLHFYNVGLVFASIMEADRAFKFFLLADEADERNKGTEPGNLFRTKDIFLSLREEFFAKWFEDIQKSFHWENLSHSKRLELFGRLLAALPGRHVLARCHLGIFRACFIWQQKRRGLESAVGEYLMAVEDLAVLTEAASRMLHEGTTAYQDDTLTLGVMFKGKIPVGNLGFVLGSSALDLKNEAAARATLNDAQYGNQAASARVIQRFRNLTAHAGAPPTWCLDTGVLSQVIAIQLDFASAVAAAYEAAHGSLFSTATSTVTPTAIALGFLGDNHDPSNLMHSASLLSSSAAPPKP